MSTCALVSFYFSLSWTFIGVILFCRNRIVNKYVRLFIVWIEKCIRSMKKWPIVWLFFSSIFYRLIVCNWVLNRVSNASIFFLNIGQFRLNSNSYRKSSCRNSSFCYFALLYYKLISFFFFNSAKIWDVIISACNIISDVVIKIWDLL